MIHPLGDNLAGRIRFSGTVSSPTGTLYTATGTGSFSSSVTTVTATASTGETDCVDYSVSTTGLTSGQRAYVEITATVNAVSETRRSAIREVRQLATIDSNGRVDLGKVAGTTQTPTNIGALKTDASGYLLLSVGTGAGQISLTSGKVAATIATGDDADGAAVKATIGTAGAGLTALATAANLAAANAGLTTLLARGDYASAVSQIAAILAAQTPVDRADPYNFVGLNNIARIAAGADTERAAMILSGNSNTLKDDYGHNSGLNYGFGLTSKVWGDGIKSLGMAGGNISGYSGSGGFRQNGTITGGPAGLEPYLTSNSTLGYEYRSDGNVQFEGLCRSTRLVTGGIAGRTLRVTQAFGTIPGSTSGAAIGIRRGDGSGAVLASSGTVSEAASDYGTTVVTLQTTMPGDCQILSYGLNQLWAPASDAKWFSYYQIDDVNITTGWSVQTITARGGQPLRVQAQDLVNMPQAMRVHFFQEALRYAGANKYCLVWINEGLNSQNDGGNLSIGPNPADSATANGWKDNINVMLPLIRQAYLLAGGIPGNLGFVLTTDHIQPAGQNTALLAYTAAGDALAASNPDVACLHLDTLFTNAELTALSYYYGGGDTAHLSSPAGYNGIGYKMALLLKVVGATATPLTTNDLTTIADSSATAVVTNPAFEDLAAAATSASTNSGETKTLVEALAGQVGGGNRTNGFKVVTIK